MIGMVFGRLTVLSSAGLRRKPCGKGETVWLCKCACGKTAYVRRSALRDGSTSSCGCLRSDVASKLKLNHGLANRSPTYDIWVLMRQRCNNPKASGYRYYGGVGVRVCARWDSFDAFLADMGERPAGLTLDRIRPEGDYEPSNCRWATWTTQNRNKRGRTALARCVAAAAEAAP